MKIEICPECKEIIPKDKLRGSSSFCHACSLRFDRSDLVEIESERAEDNAQNDLSNISSSMRNYDHDNSFDMHCHSGEIPQEEEDASVIQSLDELQLIPGVMWDNNSEQSWETTRTLIIKPFGSKSEFFFPIVWLGGCSIMFVPALVSLLSEPANGHQGKSSDLLTLILSMIVFCGIGFVILYKSIIGCMRKTWIDISHDSIGIEKAIKRRGKCIYAKRSPLSSVTMEYKYSSNRVRLYSVYIIDEIDKNKIVVANGLVYDRALELVNMLKSIMTAKI